NTGGGRNGARWYEIQNLAGAPSLLQSGTLYDGAATSPSNYWIPTIAVSGQGHAVLGCSAAGTTRHAEAGAGGRLSGDALGIMQAASTVQASASTYNIGLQQGAYRWGGG